MSTPQDHAEATRLAELIRSHAVGDHTLVGASWMHGAPAEAGEICVPMTLTPELILYRNRVMPWPQFHATGVRSESGVVVYARDAGFDASRVFLFFNTLMQALGAHRFLPEVRTYPGHVLYQVRYLL